MKKKQKYIWAFDLSLSCTGMAIFDDSMTPIKTTSYATTSKDSIGLRLKKIATFILDLMDEYPPNLVILEQAFSRFNKATATIYKVHGVVQMIFWDIPQIYYSPRTVKAAILSGNSTKEEVKEAIVERYKDIVFANNDESDAFAVGLTYFIKNGFLKWK